MFFGGPNFGSPIPLKLVFENEYRNGPHRFQKWSCVAGLCHGRHFSRLRRREGLRPAVDPGTSKNYRVLRCFVLFSFFPFFRILWLKMGQATRRRPDGSVGMALVLPALTDCRWWFESLLVHSGVSSATRRKATGAGKKKKKSGSRWANMGGGTRQVTTS